MTKTGLYAQALHRFSDRAVVTISTGITCAYLGDERNLREFLVADETARHLGEAGHPVVSLLFDDSLDPLDFRQLRIGVNKDERLMDQFRPLCGKPISHLPDPWGCHGSYAAHFEQELLTRLHGLGCHPTLISTSALYERGLYTPHVQTVLERSDEIRRFLSSRFAGYQPEKLFWPLCPHCAYLDQTYVDGVRDRVVSYTCRRCEMAGTVGFDDLRGKLNWKLDCALRWALFDVDAEPFNKAYLEPQSGSFVVAQALSQEYFGGHPVMPLHYGTVKMDRDLSFHVLPSLPSAALRRLMVESPATDLSLTSDLVRTVAARHEVLPGLSFFDFVKQLLPVWLLTPESLTAEQRELLARGAAFNRHFLGAEARLHLPKRSDFESESPAVLRAIQDVLARVIALRRTSPASGADHHEAVKQALNGLGADKKPVLHRLRILVGQEQGLPVARFLVLLPLNYLGMLDMVLSFYLGGFPTALPAPFGDDVEISCAA